MHIIAGTKQKYRILCPKGLSIRPTSSKLRETLFNICQHKIKNSIFLDLFAGTGAIGLEALSRGAAKVIFVDHNKTALRYIRKNLISLEFQNKAQVIYGDVINIIHKLHKSNTQFDIIYIDPPYGKIINKAPYSSHILKTLDTNNILSTLGTLFIEDSHLENITLDKLIEKSKRKIGSSTLCEYTI